MPHTLEIKINTFAFYDLIDADKIDVAIAASWMEEASGCYVVFGFGGKQYAHPIFRIPKTKRTARVDPEDVNPRIPYKDVRKFQGYEGEKGEMIPVTFKRAPGVFGKTGLLELIGVKELKDGLDENIKNALP